LKRFETGTFPLSKKFDINNFSFISQGPELIKKEVSIGVFKMATAFAWP